MKRFREAGHDASTWEVASGVSETQGYSVNPESKSVMEKRVVSGKGLRHVPFSQKEPNGQCPENESPAFFSEYTKHPPREIDKEHLMTFRWLKPCPVSAAWNWRTPENFQRFGNSLTS